MAVAWTADLDTGIEVIDQQHMRIVDYINELESAMIQMDVRMVGQILDELVDYTVSHFSFEETLQHEAGYEHLVPHRTTHEIFIKRVSSYQARHRSGEDVAEQLYNMLSIWLVHHIKRDDMAYVMAVKENVERIVSDKKQGGWLSRSLGKIFG